MFRTLNLGTRNSIRRNDNRYVEDGYGEYDIHSIMHYGKSAFSRCNKSTAKEFYWKNPPKGLSCKTLKALDGENQNFGMHKQLTRKREKVKYLYSLKKQEFFL